MPGISRRGALIGVAFGGAAAALGGWRWWADPPPPAAVEVDSSTTVAVTRVDLAVREQLGGVLGYAELWSITHAGPAGTLTGAPAPGTFVQRGQSLYEVDGHPVGLLIGARPVWRALAAGVPRGEDVRQLERNLVDLGYLSTGVDDRYTATTAAAVRRWQARLGVTRTGQLPLGSFVFAPEPLRIATLDTPVGGRVGGGPVLRATSTRRVVTVALPTSRQGSVRAGGSVQVTLPGGARVPATVATVGRVAVAPDGQPGAPAQPPTIAVTATLDQPDVAGDLDQAPVQVSVVTTERRGVLAVPVTALVAAAGGGYEVIAADGRRIPVRPGVFDETSGLVEVTGVAEGVRVEVPVR